MNHIFVWTIKDILGISFLILIALLVLAIKSDDIYDWFVGKFKKKK